MFENAQTPMLCVQSSPIGNLLETLDIYTQTPVVISVYLYRAVPLRDFVATSSI